MAPRPSLDDILALAAAARRSPHARRVLHDALLERYGDLYKVVLDRAQGYADQSGRPDVVVLRPNRLAVAEAQLAAGNLDPRFLLEDLNAFAAYDLQAASQGGAVYRRFRSAKDEVFVVIVKPRPVKKRRRRRRR